MKKNIIVNIFLLCVSLIAVIFISEIILKKINIFRQTSDTIIISKDSDLVYEHKPSVTFINKYKIKIHYNSLGFIGEEPGRKTDKAIRIMGVGDSITAAEYIPQSEGYLSKMAYVIKERTGKDVEIINAGISGYNTWQELRLIETKSIAVSPDIIIVGICMNDYVGKKPSLQKVGEKVYVNDLRDGSRARYFNFLYQRSDLYKLIYDMLCRFKNIIQRKNRNEEDFNYVPDDSRPWLETFKKMVIFCGEHKIKIVFCIFPTKYHMDSGLQDTFKPLSDFFSQKSIMYIDLIQPFKNNGGNILFHERDNIHPAKIGHKIAGEILADFLIKKEVLLKRGVVDNK